MLANVTSSAIASVPSTVNVSDPAGVPETDDASTLASPVTCALPAKSASYCDHVPAVIVVPLAMCNSPPVRSTSLTARLVVNVIAPASAAIEPTSTLPSAARSEASSSTRIEPGPVISELAVNRTLFSTVRSELSTSRTLPSTTPAPANVSPDCGYRSHQALSTSL